MWYRWINTFCHVNSIQWIKAFIACGKHPMKSVIGNYLHCIVRSFVHAAKKCNKTKKIDQIFYPFSLLVSIALALYPIESKAFPCIPFPMLNCWNVEIKVQNKFEQRFDAPLALNSNNLLFKLLSLSSIWMPPLEHAVHLFENSCKVIAMFRFRVKLILKLTIFDGAFSFDKLHNLFTYLRA